MNRTATALLCGALILSGTAARADQAMADQVRKAFRGKVETRFIVAEIARLGKPATPTVLDLLWGRGAFQGDARAHVALEALAKLRDESALPELRAYLQSPDTYERVPTLEAMLAIRHDAAARDEGVILLNGWIRQGALLDGLRGMLLGLPANGWTQQEVAAFASRLELDHPNLRGGIFYLLADSMSPLSEEILKEFARRSPENRAVIRAAVTEALKEHRATLARWEKGTSPPAGSQKAWLADEWKAHRRRNLAAFKELVRRDERLKAAL